MSFSSRMMWEIDQQEEELFNQSERMFNLQVAQNKREKYEESKRRDDKAKMGRASHSRRVIQTVGQICRPSHSRNLDRSRQQRASADQVDKIARMGKSTILESLMRFCRTIESMYTTEYLRKPTDLDLQKLLKKGEMRVILGCLEASTVCTGLGKTIQVYGKLTRSVVRERIKENLKGNLGIELTDYLLCNFVRAAYKTTTTQTKMAGTDVKELMVHLERNMDLSTMEHGFKLVGAGLALEEVNMEMVSFWIQTRDVPSYLITEESVRRLASKIEEFNDLEDPAMARGFLRVKVTVNTEKALITGCWLPRDNNNETWVEFRYEDYRTFECSFEPVKGDIAGYGEIVGYYGGTEIGGGDKNGFKASSSKK
ncbi:hypothetical protein D8674_028856 [Pyrus ussuriensis x Pyrus communis]|uniref:Uncharacterized protein n=1 Tax=Pyrus ussuriensis x Pyrus communis TaxID=2448454 RepID=A0A5N5HYE4_9ROSA|nr:hypothetical protein D8674_028856 [Pyrus ussuriensis x Pyrus communis]